MGRTCEEDEAVVIAVAAVAAASVASAAAGGCRKPEEADDIPSPGKISGADLGMMAEVVVVLGG